MRTQGIDAIKFDNLSSLGFIEIGITETVSPQGARVKLYDKEHCICDLIRNKDQVDIQIYTQAIIWEGFRYR